MNAPNQQPDRPSRVVLGKTEHGIAVVIEGATALVVTGSVMLTYIAVYAATHLTLQLPI